MAKTAKADITKINKKEMPMGIYLKKVQKDRKTLRIGISDLQNFNEEFMSNGVRQLKLHGIEGRNSQRH